ncbi:hypothetical protein RR42_m1443 [Cupriavidus basilensis]|uniref:Uncharacterized protein n=1 Tax=Cupriavidus basilensis TaxID=68895 RepID=A0A0C4Y9C4_9BURK|nr:hypothetical protein RR42_m1443 [Cupriavidus basilensis]
MLHGNQVLPTWNRRRGCKCGCRGGRVRHNRQCRRGRIAATGIRDSYGRDDARDDHRVQHRTGARAANRDRYRTGIPGTAVSHRNAGDDTTRDGRRQNCSGPCRCRRLRDVDEL